MFLGMFTNFENQLLAFSCLSVCPSTRNSLAPSGWIFMKFDICICFENDVHEKNSKIHLDRSQNKQTNCKGIKNNTNSG